MARIYIVTRREAGHLVRFVRAKTAAGAVGALARDLFEVAVADAQDFVDASNADVPLDILDALAVAEPVADTHDPGPVPEAGETVGAERLRAVK
jgi:hypothetical protein